MQTGLGELYLREMLHGIDDVALLSSDLKSGSFSIQKSRRYVEPFILE